MKMNARSLIDVLSLCSIVVPLEPSAPNKLFCRALSAPRPSREPPPRRRRRSAAAAASSASAPPPEAEKTTAAAAAATTTAVERSAVRNLLSVCSKLQDPDLYSPRWADACAYDETEGGALVATRDVERGEVASLYPVHAVGFLSSEDGSSAEGAEGDADWIAFDDDDDGGGDRWGGLADDDPALAAESASAFRLVVPLLDEARYPYPAFASGRRGRRGGLVVDVDPTRPIRPGWLGHLVERWSDGDDEGDADANCAIVPLPGAAPLCAVVATADVPEGGALRRRGGEGTTAEEEELATLADDVDERYAEEIAELRSYADMSYRPLLPKRAKDDGGGSAADAGRRRKRDFEEPFHSVDRDYPGLRVAHRDPDVLVVDDFLTDDECRRLIDKCETRMTPCLVKDADTGQVEEDPDRTSSNANVPRTEIPSIVSKIVQLAGCDERQLEIFQVLRYKKGERFRPHTDGFDGPVSACGFHLSGRLVTIFVYLNDVPRGGRTRFPELGLDVAPRRGRAVVHFPNTAGLEEDAATVHEGAAAIDEKWVLVTWVWKNRRSDKRYDEKNLPRLDGTII